MALEYIEHTGGIDREKPEVLFAALQILLDANPDMVFIKDEDLIYRAATRSFAKMAGKNSVDEILGKTNFELFTEKLAKRYTADDRKLMESGEDLLDYVEPLTEENGKTRYSSTSKYCLTDENGKAIGLLGVCRDISEVIRSQQMYQREVDSMYALPADVYAAIYIDITDWRLLGQRRQKVYQYSMPQFGLLENYVNYIRKAVQEKESEAYAFYQNFSRQYLLDIRDKGVGYYSLEYQFCAEDSDMRWVYDEFKFMTDPNTGHQCLMIVTRDVTKAKKG